MVCEIMHDEAFLAQKAEPATPEDLPAAQNLLDTLAAHKDGCVGMAANMIGISKHVQSGDHQEIRTLPGGGGLPVPVRHPQGKAVEVYQSSVSEREIPNPLQELYRLDGADHPARDRPLRRGAELT